MKTRIHSLILLLFTLAGIGILSSCKGGAFTSRKYTKGIFREHFSGWDSKKQVHKRQETGSLAKDSILFAEKAGHYLPLRGMNKNPGSPFPQYTKSHHKKILKKKKPPVVVTKNNKIIRRAVGVKQKPHEKKRPSEGIKIALFVFLTLLGFVIGFLVYNVLILVTGGSSGFYFMALLAGFVGIILIFICLVLLILYFSVRRHEEIGELSPEQKKEIKEEKKKKRSDPAAQREETKKLAFLYITGIIVITVLLLIDPLIALHFYIDLILLIVSLRRTLRFHRFLRKMNSNPEGNTENLQEEKRKTAQHRLFHFIMFLCFVVGMVLILTLV